MSVKIRVSGKKFVGRVSKLVSKAVSGKKQTSDAVVKMTPKERLSELKAFIGLCFACLEEFDHKEIANKTGLCVGTLYRLRSDDLTLCVRYGTIQALGIAVGLKLVSTEYGHKVVLVNPRKN